MKVLSVYLAVVSVFGSSAQSIPILKVSAEKAQCDGHEQSVPISEYTEHKHPPDKAQKARAAANQMMLRIGCFHTNQDLPYFSANDSGLLQEHEVGSNVYFAAKRCHASLASLSTANLARGEYWEASTDATFTFDARHDQCLTSSVLISIQPALHALAKPR